MNEALTLDGAYGEGGGQILRTALSLSMITGRAFRIINLRARRRHPGLMPQHLSAVRAAATIVAATVSGDHIGSTEVVFAPQHGPRAGSYAVDVADASALGSAGSITLILQTLAVPLAFATGHSMLHLRGGTHVEWSPPFDDIVATYLPALHRMNIGVDAEIKHSGWYPRGGGEVVCHVSGGLSLSSPLHLPQPLVISERGPLECIRGRAIAANLPAHIPQRMADRARTQLASLGVPLTISAERVTANSPGAGLFLTAEYRHFPASFSAYGRLGKRAETVAEEAVARLVEHHHSGASVDRHLADQILLPLAFARGPSAFTVAQATGHLVTNAWTIGCFAAAAVAINSVATPVEVRVEPHALPLR